MCIKTMTICDIDNIEIMSETQSLSVVESSAVAIGVYSDAESECHVNVDSDDGDLPPLHQNSGDIKDDTDDKKQSGHVRPPYSYIALISMAVMQAPKKRVTLSEICDFIMNFSPLPLSFPW